MAKLTAKDLLISGLPGGSRYVRNKHTGEKGGYPLDISVEAGSAAIGIPATLRQLSGKPVSGVVNMATMALTLAQLGIITNNLNKARKATVFTKIKNKLTK